ncbi:hypothetical protein ACFLXE_07870, partial [Chloroflexota bacterium]
VLADMWGSTDPTPWWAVAMVPVGIIGTIGGAMARWKANIAGVMLLLAGVSALAVGIASAEETFGSYSSAMTVLSMHPFIGSIFYFPPLIMLIVGGSLAFSAKKDTSREADNVGDLVLSLVSTVITKLRRKPSDVNKAQDAKTD